MVWLNPVTGEKCFQVMAEIVHKLYFKDAPHEAEEEIRVWLNRIFDRLTRPEYLMIPRTEEGDMVIWNNWVLSQLLVLHWSIFADVTQGVLHSAIEYPLSYGPRSGKVPFTTTKR